MDTRFTISLTKIILFFALALNSIGVYSQEPTNFWDNVRVGGALGVGFGTGYTDISIAPSAIYQFNDYAALGLGVQGTYVHQRDYYDSYIYGGSVIGLFNPIPQVQLSAELEQLRVNLNVDEAYASYYTNLNFRDRNFWNTALFFGAGYRMDNVTVGLRYNVLYSKKDLVYSDAIMPFVRVYF